MWSTFYYYLLLLSLLLLLLSFFENIFILNFNIFVIILFTYLFFFLLLFLYTLMLRKLENENIYTFLIGFKRFYIETLLIFKLYISLWRKRLLWFDTAIKNYLLINNEFSYILLYFVFWNSLKLVLIVYYCSCYLCCYHCDFVSYFTFHLGYDHAQYLWKFHRY